MSEARFAVNARHIMSETIEGEVIAINLVSGNYYSITGAGAYVWEVMSSAGPLSVAELVEAVAQRFDGPQVEIDRSVRHFVDELHEETLIAAVESVRRNDTMVPRNDTVRQVFEQPRLETYTDMQDLVLLDPVHQVEDTGWPQAQVDARPGSHASAA